MDILFFSLDIYFFLTCDRITKFISFYNVDFFFSYLFHVRGIKRKVFAVGIREVIFDKK